MARLALKALVAALLFAPQALHAQQARVVTNCGSLAPFGPQAAGGSAFPTMDITGRLCLSSSGGSGGGTITANSTPTSGFTASQLLMSDGSLTQAAGAVTGVSSQYIGTSPQAHRVYNTRTDASNGEWAALDWLTTPNVLTIGTQNNGTGTARGIQFVRGASGVMDFGVTIAGWINMPTPVNMTNTFQAVGINSITGGGIPQPTIAGSGGTCATSTKVGGATAGTVVLSGVCASGNTIVFTSVNTGPANGFACDAEDRTTQTAGPFIESATTTTGFTLKVGATSSVAGDVLQWKCMGY